MSSFSVGDEVRFRTSPDVIDDTEHVKSQSWTKYTSRPGGGAPERRLRLQAVVNKAGQIELDLSGREMRDVPREVYSQLRLEVLRLNDNRLHALSSAVSHLHKLRVLHAHGNALQSLPDTLTNCIHLQEVDLSRNRLIALPASISQLSKLKVLRLSHNSFESVPHELGDLASLQRLELAGNKLWHLPYSLQDLRHLKYLNLADNLFEQLPVCLCFLPALEALDLRRNKIINLPPDFDALKNLRELSLAHNKLETLPYVIPHLRQLHSLDLGHNRLKSVPPRLAKLPKLRMLMLPGNAIASLPNNLETLEYLNASDNRLHNFSVAHMRRLRYLSAAHNQLENAPLGVYNLRHLEVLKLDNNRISYLSQDVVLLKRLRNLDLGNNQLTSLPNVINELEHLETFNVKGNRIEARPGHPPREGARAPSRSAYPAGQANIRGGNPHYMGHEEAEEGYGVEGHGGGGRYFRRKPQSPLAKKKSNWRDKFTLRRKSPPKSAAGAGGGHLSPHSQHAGTQYTPKSSAKSRERPPLDYKPSSNSLSSILSLPKSKATSHTQTNGNGNGNGEPVTARSVAGVSNAPTAVLISNPLSVSEISYPMGSAPLGTRGGSQGPGEAGEHQSNHIPNGPTNTWAAERRAQPDSIRSDTVTINSMVGDELSLGDEDYEYQPTTVADARLIGVCTEVEGMLNKQLLQPFTQTTRGIFRKGMNEGGTLRTLNSITSGSLRRYHQGDATAKVATADGVVHMSSDHFMKHRARSEPNLVHTNGLARSKIDAFKVTPAGGLFRSSMDTKVTLYFPVNAVETPLTFTMQLEQVDPAAVEQAKQQDQHVENLVAVGDIVHIKQSRPTNFHQQVTLTLPAPMTSAKGRLHLLVYHDDNTCSPSSSHFKIHHGYITVQAWHFSGIGAVITNSKSKTKACKSMERLLQCLYV